MDFLLAVLHTPSINKEKEKKGLQPLSALMGVPKLSSCFFPLSKELELRCLHFPTDGNSIKMN